MLGGNTKATNGKSEVKGICVLNSGLGAQQLRYIQIEQHIKSHFHTKKRREHKQPNTNPELETGGQLPYPIPAPCYPTLHGVGAPCSITQ